MKVVEYRTTPSRVELISFAGGDNQVAMSAWISFGNDKEERLADQNRVAKLIDFLYRERHMTPFQSSTFTFRAEVPISTMRHIQRHRSQSLNEWSARYSEMLPVFYVPNRERPLQQAGKPGDYYFIPGTDEQHAIVLQNHRKTVQTCWDSYKQMLEYGVAKEVARNVLPVNMFTQFYLTIDARNLMHFIDLRKDSHALYEIRHFAGLLEEELKKTMPLTWEAYNKHGGK